MANWLQLLLWKKRCHVKASLKMRDECNIIGVPISDVEMKFIDDHFSVGGQSVVPLDYFTQRTKSQG